jgi:hypothetical protein
MRIRIVRVPPIASLDGVRLDRFAVGREYEMGNTIGSLLLAEGWAEAIRWTHHARLSHLSTN